MLNLTTLTDASRHIGKPRDYFTVRKGKATNFPAPAGFIGSRAAWDLDELIAWNDARLEKYGKHCRNERK